MTTLADTLAEYLADQRAATEAHRVTASRAFMAGALAVLVLRSKGASESALLAECRQFGRAIGTAAERAG